MQLWRFYEQIVGMWTIESNRSPFRYPLKPDEDTSGPKREYFNYLTRAMDASGDLFMLRYVENPPGNVILKSYGQLLPAEIQSELTASWDKKAKESGIWMPTAIFGGLSRIHVKENSMVLPVEIPGRPADCTIGFRRPLPSHAGHQLRPVAGSVHLGRG
jgi:hypothetical protein